jgi:hypothetical protein
MISLRHYTVPVVDSDNFTIVYVLEESIGRSKQMGIVSPGTTTPKDGTWDFSKNMKRPSEHDFQ